MGPGVVRDGRKGNLFGVPAAVAVAVPGPGPALDGLHPREQIGSEPGREVGFIGQLKVAHAPPLHIGPLHGIYQGTPLQGHPAPVGRERIVGRDPAYRHRQIQRDGIAPPPAATQAHVAVTHPQRHPPSLNGQNRFLPVPAGIGKAIEVARDRLAPRPARDTDVKGQALRPVLAGIDGDRHPSLPGIAGLLGQTHRPARQGEPGLAGGEEVDIDRRAAGGVDITRHRGDEAGHVAGAAGAVEPGSAGVLAHALEGVGVKEGVPFERDPREQGVVESPLHHVDVFTLAVEQEHAVVPVDVSDRGAGLAVGAHVGQGVTRPEALVAPGSADPAGQVELAPGHVLPQPVDRLDVGSISGQGGHVGHAGVHVRRPHGVSDGFGLLGHGGVVLVVLPPQLPAAQRPAAHVEKVLRQPQPALITGDPAEPHQAHLDHLVARWFLVEAGTEHGVEQFGVLQGDVEQVPFARGQEVGRGGLVEMTGVVEFVTAAQTLPALGPEPAAQAARIVGAGCVEVAVRFLGRADQGDDRVQIGLQRRIGPGHQGVGGPLDGLVHVGVVEGV